MIAIVDADGLRQGDLEDVADRTVRSTLGLMEVLGAGSYEEAALSTQEPAPIPFDEDDETSEQTVDGSRAPRVVPEVTRRTVADKSDTSVLVPMHRNKFQESSRLGKALATYAELTGLSRQDWAALREVLFLIRDKDGETPPEILELPRHLATLKDHLRKRMPMMDMRKAKIPLNVLKLPTLVPGLKPDEKRRLEAYRELSDAKEVLATAKKNLKAVIKGKGKNSSDAIAANAEVASAKAEVKDVVERIKDRGLPELDIDDLPKVHMDLTFLDPETIFKNIAASDIGKRSHSGPGIIVDEPKELFQSHAWLSSVRTSSGIYPHIILDTVTGRRGAAVFPSDWIYYRCTNESCDIGCHEIQDDDDNITDIHIGRVYGFGYDERTKSCTKNRSINGVRELALQIQEAHRVDSVVTRNIDLNPIHEEDELILSNVIEHIPESNIHAHVTAGVYIDHIHGEIQDDPGWAFASKSEKKYEPLKKYNHQLWHTKRENEWYFCRRMISNNGSETTVTPMCHTHAIRGNLELEHFGRKAFEEKWDQEVPGVLPVVSFPHLDFIDGFGVFRNSYRTLMGFYFTPAGLLGTERARPGSIFPIVLGPHASNFGDVVKALRTMSYLDSGVETDLDGRKVRLCAFPLCYIGDMPQQAENSGMKGPRAKKFCRFCYAFSKKETVAADEQLNLDLVEQGRYHHQILEMQANMAELGDEESGVVKRYGTQWGIATPSPPLATLSPALDLVISRPLDPAHSEYNGLGNLMHFLLRDGILTIAAKAEYAMALRAWPFPPGARRLQSTQHHLASYSMSDHALWTIVVPAFLLSWLKRKHIRKDVYNEAWHDSGCDPVELIVETCAAIAKSSVVLMGRNVTKEDRDNIEDIIIRARRLFNQLCLYVSTTSRGSAAGSAAGSAVGTRAGTPAAGGEEEDGQGGKRSLKYMNDTLRPNIHVGMHYPEIAEEYALPVNVNTLTGENLHR
jgi:hypothetical protein